MPIAAMSTDATMRKHAGADVPTRPSLINGIEISLVRTTRPRERMTEADKIRPGQARRIGLAHLRHWGLESLMDDAAVVISELVTNAFQHGKGSSVGLRLCHTPTCVRVEVTDGTSAAPAARTSGLLDESGRGLFLVDAIAESWGVSEDGTRTWCTLPLSPGPGDAMQPTAVSAPITREWSTSLPPTANAVRLACVNARTRLTRLRWNGNIHGASEIVRRLVANALDQGVDDHGPDLQLRLAITETGELLTEVSDPNPGFPDFSAAIDGGRLREVRKLGAHVTWYMLPAGGKTVQARVGAGEVPA